MNDDRLTELQSLLPRCLTREWVRLGARLVRLLRDHHHAARHDEILNRLLSQARRSVELRARRADHVPRCTYPEALPITLRKNEIVAAIRAHQVVVIAGETGSGKTTQIPKMCLEAGLGIEAMVGCTQPRRVAALSISRRIAEELKVDWGREVGCKIRFDDQSGPETYLKMMTDGILLAETQGDPLLADYNALIIDEAHERSLNIDFLLGYLKGLLGRRPDLKLIITSATIDTGAFSRAFDNAPVIEVSGRTYPVEVVYEPLESESEERGDWSYVDAAVRATTQVVDQSSRGDILIFLPGERDIREAADQLVGRLGGDVEVIPLHGRLSVGDQQRVFAASPRRKIVVATNIAETSLTIPGIRFVIDSGLARISRYNPRTRTRRLPIEPISQSSANQRKGRAGRVEAGICIRLFSEDDYLARPPHTQPEIQRANLAEVILRMKAFRLGEIETFPFLNPPSPAVIAGGFTLLRELGALEESGQLTPLGHDLARLPIDPTLGRMLWQARQEHATRELLIIASGLSIQDPRERPADHQSTADALHRRHAHPASDFLGFLNLWNYVEQNWADLRTHGQRRKFCQANFLSYLRLREWQDLQEQLAGALHDLIEEDQAPAQPKSPRPALNSGSRPGNPAYDAIHRSILAGLLGQIAIREENNQYKSVGNRQMMLFPGSALFVRMEKPRRSILARTSEAPRSAKGGQPAWIVAGEIVETSQLFARTVAAIDPGWIPDLGPHLVKVAHQNPRWIASSGQVMIDEICTLRGLEVRRRRVAFGNLDSKAATSLFIRSALVEEELQPSTPNDSIDQEPSVSNWRQQSVPVRLALPPQYRFLEHNRRLRETIESWQTRVRHRSVDADQALFEFYSRHLNQVSTLAELNRQLQAWGGPERLFAQESDLTAGRDLSYDSLAFPETVALGGQPVALCYAYAPGEEHDGVTVRLPFALIDSVSPAVLDWAIPGLRAGLVEEWLRALPKAARRHLQPIPPKVAEIVRDLHPAGPTLGHDFARFLRQRYDLVVSAEDVAPESLPTHLRARVEVIGPDQRPLAWGRDFALVRAGLPEKRPVEPSESAVWKAATQSWERFGLTGWNFGDLPDRIDLGNDGTSPRFAWPGLEAEEGQVNLRLFATDTAAQQASRAGVVRLLELALGRELAWLQKDLRSLSRIAHLYVLLGTGEDLQETAFQHARRHILQLESLPALNQQEFNLAVERCRSRLPELVPPLLERIKQVLELRQQVTQRLGAKASPVPERPKSAKGFGQLEQLLTVPTTRLPAAAGSTWLGELNALVPPRFLESLPFVRLADLPRYLKALLLRIERAEQNPPKDLERQRQVEPFVNALRALQAKGEGQDNALLGEFQWLIEEFKVSLFAQELGTAVPVSAKRLSDQLAHLRSR